MNHLVPNTSARRRVLAGSIAGSIGTILLAALFSQGANLTWDISPGVVGPGDGVITGGSGTWDTTSGFWTADGGVNDAAWNNANTDLAIFDQAGGFVSLGSAITAGGLSFNVSDYTLSGNTITLAGATPTITVGTGLNATVSSVLAGTSGVTIGGGGTLTLTSANTVTGGVTVNSGTVNLNIGGGTGTLRGALNINSGGTVNLASVDALGYTVGVQVDTVNINGGTLNNTTTGNEAYATNFVLTAGTMSSSGGGSYNFNTGYGISTNSSSGTSYITAPILIRAGALTFTTAAGTTPTGIDLSVTGIITGGTFSVIKAGSGTMTIGATTNYTGGTTVNGGILDLSAGGGATGVIRGTATVNTGATLQLSTADALGYTTQVTALNVNHGTVNVNSTGNQTFSNMTLTMNAGTLTGISGSNIDLFNNGTSIVTTAATTSSVISAPNVGLRQNDTVFNIADGAAAVDLLVSGNLINNGGANNQGNHNLIKNGLGVMQFTGTNSYTGTTKVNAGTLALAGSGTLASPSLSIASGAILDVSGLSAGSFSLNFGQSLTAGRTSGFAADVIGNLTSGFGIINIVGPGLAGTMTLGGASAGNLTLNGGSVNFDLANVPTVGGGVNDLLSVANLTLTGLTNIAINKLNGALTTNTYTLFKYSGTLQGDTSNLTLTGAAGGTTRQSFLLDTASTPGSVLLKVAGSSANLTWAGDDTNNYWDVVNTTNFLNGATRDKFYDGDAVTFDDTGSNNPTILLTGDVAPGSLVVNNTSKDYTFTGASINGGLGLVKNGSGTLTLNNTSNFIGAPAINAGTVSVASLADGGNGSPLGAGTSVTLGDATHAGKLQVTGVGSVLATNRALTVNAGGGELEVVDPGTTVTQNGAIVLNGPLTKSGAGALNLSGAISGPGSFTMTGGTVTATTFTSYTGDLNINGGVYNTGLGLANGVTTSLGAGTGTRNVNIAAGAVMNWTSNNILMGGGGSAASLPTVVINGGTLSSTRYNMIGNVVLNSGAVLTQSATDTGNYEGYQFIGTVTAGGNAASTITTTAGKANHLRGGGTTVFNVADATGDVNPDLIISTVLRDGSGDYTGVGALQKTGVGTLNLTALNTYTGATTVSAGTLSLTEGGYLASTAINVANGATLDSSGIGIFTLNPAVSMAISPGGQTIGSMTVLNGATLTAGRPSAAATDLTGDLTSYGNINVAGIGTAGTFKLGGTGNLLLGGGTLNFDLDATATVGGGVNDLVVAAGDLDLSGVTTIAVTRLNGLLANGSYTLINYTGSLIGDTSNLNLLGLTNTPRQSFTLDLSTPKALVLQVTGTTDSLVWVGNGQGNEWDYVTPNWNGSTDHHFLDGDSVTFNDTGSNSSAVQINGVLQPSAVLVNNSTKDYIFSGSGQIDGQTSLVKSGTGTLTIQNFNSFTGNVAINAGTISVTSVDNIGNFSPLGAGTDITLGDATHQGTLQFAAVGVFGTTNRNFNLSAGGGVIDVPDAGANLTLTAPINGVGSLTKTGSGTLTLSAMEAFTGGTVVNGGTLALTVGGIVGTLAGTVTVNPGATVQAQVKDALGYGPGRATTININGGTFSQAAAANLSVWGMTVNMTGGTLQASVAGSQLDFGTDANASNVLTVINTFASPNVSTIGGTLVNLRQATTSFNVAKGTASTDLLVSAPVGEGVVGSGITKAGAGTMTLSGTNTYTGPTIVNAGTLLVTGSIAGSPVTVNNGGTLGGVGTTGVLNAASGGVVAPGASVGTLQTGSLTMAAGSTLRLDLNTTVPSSGYDQLSITGSVDVTGATLSLGGSYVQAPGATNDLFFVLLNDNSDGITGQFNGLNEGSLVQASDGQFFTLTYFANADSLSFTGGNDVALLAIPEPGSAWSFCSGFGLCLGLLRRRRAMAKPTRLSSMPAGNSSPD